MLINQLQSCLLKLDKTNNFEISVIYDEEAQWFLFVFLCSNTRVEWEAFLYYVYRFHYNNLSVLYIYIESICHQNQQALSDFYLDKCLHVKWSLQNKALEVSGSPESTILGLLNLIYIISYLKPGTALTKSGIIMSLLFH